MKNTLFQFEKTVDEILNLKEISEAKLCQPISEGKWSIRDIVGHLYYWDKLNLEQMLPLISEGVDDLPKFPDHDKHNEEAISSLKDYSVKFIIDNFVITRKELTDKVSNLGEDIRFTIGGGKRQFSVKSFIKIFIKHDIHHLKQINDTLHKQK